MFRLNDRRSKLFNEAKAMIPLDYLQSLCIEAADLFGDDWAAINRHIAEKLGALVETDRKDLLAEVERILRAHVPDAPSARRLQ